MSGRKQWSKQAATSSFLDKKTPQSLIQQGLEGFTVVGKDEVGSANLPSSSAPCLQICRIHIYSKGFGAIQRKDMKHPLQSELSGFGRQRMFLFFLDFMRVCGAVDLRIKLDMKIKKCSNSKAKSENSYDLNPFVYFSFRSIAVLWHRYV